jgi:hypothetical protein
LVNCIGAGVTGIPLFDFDETSFLAVAAIFRSLKRLNPLGQT